MELSLPSSVQSHHIYMYKRTWTPTIGEVLVCEHVGEVLVCEHETVTWKIGKWRQCCRGGQLLAIYVKKSLVACFPFLRRGGMMEVYCQRSTELITESYYSTKLYCHRLCPTGQSLPFSGCALLRRSLPLPTFWGGNKFSLAKRAKSTKAAPWSLSVPACAGDNN